MDQVRFAGAAQQAIGTIKQVIGTALHDAKLIADGEAEILAGKIRNALDGIREDLKS